MNSVGIPKVVFSAPDAVTPRSWGGPVRLLFPSDDRRVSLESGNSVWRVVGGPGTGKSALLADLAVAYIRAGVSPDQILVVSQSKDAAARMRTEIARQLVEAEGQAGVTASSGGLVRAMHSLAFAVVREAAVRRGEPEPSLTTGAKQDASVRTLLQGHAQLGGAYWPDRLKPALELQGMARGVRDFLLRAAERGLTGSDLQELGNRFDIEEWSACGKFMDEYRQTLRLGWHTDLNAAELVTQALAEVEKDPQLLQRWGIRVVIIDDAQHVDPQSAQLLRAFIEHSDLAVVTGDEDQSVLHFRGASNKFLESVASADQTIVLHTSYRCVPEIATFANAVSKPLPKAPLQRGIRGVNSGIVSEDANASSMPARRIAIHPTQASEYADIANFLRRLNVEQGVAWKDMVVLVRSGAGDSPLHRSLARSGVPVQVDMTDIVLGEQRLVKALLLALEAVSTGLDEGRWEEFLKGPLVGMEPVSFARLIRGVRSTDLTGKPAMERIVDVLRSPELEPEHEALLASLPTRERTLLEYPLELLAKGRSARKLGVELVLWELWNATGLADHLVAASLRGGAAGATADRDLDAVMALFDFAGDLAESNPRITATGLIQAIKEQELPIGARDRRAADRDAVSILSAHAALGREWEAVAVCGVQESVWPSLSITGSILRQEDLVALLDDGIEPGTPVSYLSDRLAEERRLFHVAVSRARQHVLVTAVDNPEEVGNPSPFMQELTQQFGVERISLDAAEIESAAAIGVNPDGENTVGEVDVPAGRLLAVSTLLAELRAVVVDESQTVTRRKQAAWQLARLAEAGVVGAHPDSWWGLPKPSTSEPLSGNGPVRVSPSKVEGTLTCPLRAKLEPYEESAAMSLGTMFHDAAEALAKGVDIADVREEIRRIYPLISTEPRWRHESEVNAWLEALDAWQSWIETKKSLGSEIGVRVNVRNDIEISGRIDQLIYDGDGNVQIVDIKTSKNSATKAEAEDHAQLATYQLALSRGEITENHGETLIRNGAGIGQSGAYLVYPRKPTAKGLPTTREQSKYTEERLSDWEDTVVNVAEAIKAPNALAVINNNCNFCKVKSSCPAVDGKR